MANGRMLALYSDDLLTFNLKIMKILFLNHAFKHLFYT